MMRLILYTQLLHCIGGVCEANIVDTGIALHCMGGVCEANNGLISTQCRGATPQAALPTPAWDTTSTTSNPKERYLTPQACDTTSTTSLGHHKQPNRRHLTPKATQKKAFNTTSNPTEKAFIQPNTLAPHQYYTSHNQNAKG